LNRQTIAARVEKHPMERVKTLLVAVVVVAVVVVAERAGTRAQAAV
jgi:hypothetical protein